MPRVTHSAAARALAERDEVMAALVETIGPPRIRPAQRTPFEALARAICFQQLSGKAAATIYGRWEQEVAASSPTGEVTPEAVLATPEEHMRRAGMSAAKTASVVDLA
ncbi:MAG TPA: hypothetical protein VF230_01350, partial [Acidimicrobiales bacterium]